MAADGEGLGGFRDDAGAGCESNDGLQLFFDQGVVILVVHLAQMGVETGFALEVDLLDLVVFGHGDDDGGAWVPGGEVDVCAGHYCGFSGSSAPAEHLER